MIATISLAHYEREKARITGAASSGPAIFFCRKIALALALEKHVIDAIMFDIRLHNDDVISLKKSSKII